MPITVYQTCPKGLYIITTITLLQLQIAQENGKDNSSNICFKNQDLYLLLFLATKH